jgi:CubicO group peptidase (beta-lactamase class C family)
MTTAGIPCVLCHKATAADLTDLIEQARSAGYDVESVVAHRACVVQNPTGIADAVKLVTGTALVMIVRDG